MLDSSPAQFPTDLAQGYEDEFRSFVRGDAAFEICLRKPAPGKGFHNARSLPAMPFERIVEGGMRTGGRKAKA